jgi:hypothetical protein
MRALLDVVVICLTDTSAWRRVLKTAFFYNLAAASTNPEVNSIEAVLAKLSLFLGKPAPLVRLSVHRITPVPLHVKHTSDNAPC